MALKPTPEQQRIIDAASTGADLVIEAGAGSGKTSTLKMVAAAAPRKRGVYVAYNRAIAADAAKAFPASVLCKTAHGLAYGAVGSRFRHRLNAPRLPARETARILGINEPLVLGTDRAPLAPQQLARLVMSTVTNFCHSDDDQPTRWHVPVVNGLEAPLARAALAGAILPWATAAWADLTRPDGRLRFTHDVYLKLWALSRPQLEADYVLLDEAQDSNPCVSGVVNGRQKDTQRILVGDRCQAIYGWRGARDAMAGFDGLRLVLSQSFRFGPAIAAEANKWLDVLDAELRLTGYDAIGSRVDQLDAPAAILCRTNAEAVRQALAARTAGRRAALVGGGNDIRQLAEAAIDLRAGRGTAHPELCAFRTWAEVQAYVTEDAAGSDLKVAVGLIDSYGPEGMLEILASLVDERIADVVLSTAHKAKGREWATVRIADDFREPKASKDNPDPEVPREDAMLAYVAVTRARQVLDRSGLAWVDRWVIGGQYLADPAARIAAVAEIAPEYVVPTDDPDRPLTAAEAFAERLDDDLVELTPPPGVVPLCMRCGGGDTCTCDPEAAAVWSARLGLPAGPPSARVGVRRG